ncbi:DUF262 domain-containing protein [Actinobacillus equuli subsp. haemolyticus]|uniref:DUF262 domain-containing protein n=1 Tax=Actinobacillus equuli TaxID=718 RepID=UPI0024435542|nr:DUF262 domain-containing protein [Actinobacillus equuli]WGE81262.1 DUF262 domain-containing protein [Actinobacillus equuli subsp. haemolyticus]
MLQLKPSVTNPTIADIYDKISSGRLNLSPDFQRKFVWTQEHQEEFIDTILNGYPFPEIYVCSDDYDDEKMLTSQKVIDGQQRLTTIKNYIEGIFNNKLRKIPSFTDLSNEQRKQFMSYQMVFRDIGDVNDELVREIFRRINLTKFKLEDIEIHNAVYDGYFISTAKKILERIPKNYFDIFHESELTRMSDLHFLLQVMATIELGGYYTGDKELEPTISKYNESYENTDFIMKRLINIFERISKIGLSDSSIWLRKSNFFTMIVEFYNNYKDIEKQSNKKLKDKLNNLEIDIINNKSKENEYGEYYNAMYSGTNSRKSRVIRSNLFKKYILN